MTLKLIMMKLKEEFPDEIQFNFIIGHFELCCNVPLEKVETISIIVEDQKIQLD